MQRQDKATTERHAKILREMVKRPENKVCADCKRNDPRWASWNIGVFVCIRCSGIHRSMGTHISKVKSVDLDTWSVEQLQTIQRWGNHRANLYWEAHLRQGHAPPEHKIDSFIRSKYELRRWAMEGSPPSDPSTLENQNGNVPEHVTAVESQPVPAPPPSQAVRSQIRTTQPKPRHVLHSLTASSSSSSGFGAQSQSTTTTAVQPAPTATAPVPAVNDLFSLDFHEPTQPASNAFPDYNAPTGAGKKSAKDDIMSLFTPTQPSSSQTLFAAQSGPAAVGINGSTGAFTNGSMNTHSTSLWGAPQSSTPLAGSITQASGVGSGASAWGAQAAWGASATPSAYPSAQQTNVWGSAAPAGPAQGNANSVGIFSSADVWGAPVSGGTQSADLFSKPATTTAKDDAFGDIWGGFK